MIGCGKTDHSVVINREHIVGIAGHSDKAEAIALALGDADNCKFGSGVSRVASQSVDQSRISPWRRPLSTQSWCHRVIPIGKGDYGSIYQINRRLTKNQ